VADVRVGVQGNHSKDVRDMVFAVCSEVVDGGFVAVDVGGRGKEHFIFSLLEMYRYLCLPIRFKGGGPLYIGECSGDAQVRCSGMS
jgi:hypothetical protein